MLTNPIMSEFDAILRYYNVLEAQVEEMQVSHRVGPLLFLTDPLHQALLSEIKVWKRCYAKYLNDKCAREMDEMLEFFDTMMKRLTRPIKDLDDVRSQMAALGEIRESEIKTDMTITPIEEAYVMLNRYNLIFNDGNAERVDSLSYQWKLLKGQVSQGQRKWVKVEELFKSESW